QSEIETQQQQLSNEQERVSTLERELADSNSKLVAAKEAPQPPRAALEAPPVAVAVAEPNPVAPTTIQPRHIESQATEKAAEKAAEKTTEQAALTAEEITSSRGEFHTRLQKIQSQIMERKNLIDSVKSRGRGVALVLQPLVAKDGTSLD